MFFFLEKKENNLQRNLNAILVVQDNLTEIKILMKLKSPITLITKEKSDKMKEKRKKMQRKLYKSYQENKYRKKIIENKKQTIEN